MTRDWTAGLLFFALLAVAACGHGDSGASVASARCAQTHSANPVAFDDYRNGRFADAIKQSNGECAPQDWQLIFSSYASLYVQNPSAQLKQDANKQIAIFYRHPVWYADPGPLLVVMGEDKEAMRWYQRCMESVEKGKLGVTDKQAAVSKAYFAKALALIESAQWPKLGVNEKLSRLLEAARVRDGQGPSGPRAADGEGI